MTTATGASGYRWPGADLDTRHFLDHATGGRSRELLYGQTPEVMRAGIWHSLETLAKEAVPDLDAMERCFVNALRGTGSGPVPLLVALLWEPTNSEILVQIGHPATEMRATDERVESDIIRKPSHTRLAQDLKDMTGLSAATLGGSFGVTREQYQRWLAGKPISTVRHGQLVFTHTVVSDVARRLGIEAGRIWWCTPIDGATTPADLLARRRLDDVYKLVLAVPDAQPVVDGVLQSLPRQMDIDDWDEDDAPGEPWSPYEGTGKQQ